MDHCREFRFTHYEPRLDGFLANCKEGLLHELVLRCEVCMSYFEGADFIVSSQAVRALGTPNLLASKLVTLNAVRCYLESPSTCDRDYAYLFRSVAGSCRLRSATSPSSSAAHTAHAWHGLRSCDSALWTTEVEWMKSQEIVRIRLSLPVESGWMDYLAGWMGLLRLCHEATKPWTTKCDRPCSAVILRTWYVSVLRTASPLFVESVPKRPTTNPSTPVPRFAYF